MPQEIKYLVEEKNNELDIFKIFRILKENFKLLIILSVVFLLLSSAFVLTRPAEYYSSFPVDLNKDVSSSIINDLKNSSKFSAEELQSIVKLTDEEVDHFNFIHISSILTGEISHTAIINISTTDPSYIEPILNKLIDWVSTNPYVLKKIDNKIKKIDLLIAKTDEQLLEIKTLKEKMLASTTTQENNPFSFTGEFSIYNNKLKFTEEKENLKSLNLDSQIFIPKEAKNESKVIPLFFAITFSFIIALFLTILMKIKKED